MSEAAQQTAGHETDTALLYLGTFAAQVATLFLGMASGILAARLLTPAGRGEMVVILYFPSLMGTVFCLGIPGAVTFFVAREPARAMEFSAAGLRLALALGAAGAVLFALIAPLTLQVENRKLAGAVALACLASPAMVVQPHLMAIHRGLRRFGWVNGMLILVAAVFPALMGLAWVMGGRTALWAVLAALAAQTVSVLLSIWRLGWATFWCSVRPSVYWQEAKQGLRYFVPVVGCALYQVADRAILMSTSALTELGYYAVAFGLTFPLTLVAEPFSQIGFVEISGAGSAERSRDLLVRRFQVAQVPVFAAALLLLPFLHPLVTVAFGAAYAPAARAAPLLLAAMAFRGLSRMMENSLRACDLAWPGIAASGLALVVLAALGATLVPGRGITAFALALVLSEAMYLAVLVGAARWRFELPLATLWGLRPRIIAAVARQAVALAVRIVRVERTRLLAMLPAGLRDRLHWWRQLRGCRDFNRADLERVFRAICAQIDVARIERLADQVRSSLERQPDSAAKYPDYRYWTRLNICRAARLGLHRSRGLRVLDLGCGQGYFLAVCRHFGHEVTGLDTPAHCQTAVEQRVFSETLSALGCTIHTAGIQSLRPMAIQGSFEVITGFLVCFNNHKRPDEWSYSQWEYFLRDCQSHLAEGGRIWLELNDNRERYGKLTWYDRQTLRLFRSRGTVRGSTVVVGQVASRDP